MNPIRRWPRSRRCWTPISAPRGRRQRHQPWHHGLGGMPVDEDERDVVRRQVSGQPVVERGERDDQLVDQAVEHQPRKRLLVGGVLLDHVPRGEPASTPACRPRSPASCAPRTTSRKAGLSICPGINQREDVRTPGATALHLGVGAVPQNRRGLGNPPWVSGRMARMGVVGQ